MGDFLKFETMMTPAVIQIAFWLAVAATIIAGIVGIIGTGDARWILLIVLGPIGARVYAEIIIVFFRINDHLRAIQHYTQRE